VVDDDPEYLMTLCEALKERGVATLRARTLDEALEALAREGPGAVLLDLKLDHVDPKMSLLAIRDVSPSVLLILYSGHSSELTRTLDEVPRGLVDAAFLKPLPIEQLVARLHGYR
jgi:DNA-binding response OmpR family regulator